MNRRILYVQYTNPAGYPPLEHSAHILARAGWDVLFLGIDAFGANDLTMRPHENIRVENLGSRSGGALGNAKYARFLARALAAARKFRPHWIYASDALAAPVSLALRRFTGARLLYHEHDAPAFGSSIKDRALSRSRGQIIRTADVLVAPGAERAQLFGSAAGRAHVVWNCPTRDEAGSHAAESNSAVRLVYAGSLSPDRLQESFVLALAALPGHVSLDIFGYRTIGARDYLDRLMRAARERGLEERVSYRGSMPLRSDLLAEVRTRQIGIATVNTTIGDVNLRSLVGPSNKPFDYMASGIPFLVNGQPDWVSTFVEPGYALAVDPQSPDSIAAAVSALLDASRRSEMGTRARARILDDWNYEHQFAPVLAELTA